MKRSTQILVIILFILFAFWVFSLAQKVETVNGVRVIHNETKGKWEEQPEVVLELVRKVGDIDTADENLAFHFPNDIAVDSKGNLYILDSGNHRIQKFDAEGRYISTLGREGQGPGEFYFPESLELDPEGYIYISDPNNQRIQILNPDGMEFKTIRKTDESVGAVELGPSGQMVMGTGRGYMMVRFDEEDEKALPKLLKILDAEGQIKDEFGEPLDYKDELLNRMGNRIEFTVDQDGSIYAAFTYQNRIEKFSPQGKALWRADRSLSYSTDKPKKKGKIERRGGNVSLQMPQMNTCSRGIAVDGMQRIWVVTLKRQLKEEEQVQTMMTVTGSIGGGRTQSMKVMGDQELRETDAFELDIFSRDGILLGRIPLEHFVDGIWIAGTRLFLLDRMRGVTFYEYRIIEK